jgi:MtN3 and saliva related transmembrane protein
MDITSMIGFTAAILTTIAFVPQAIKIIVSKNTKDISLGMYVIFNLGVLFWLVYGIITFDLPIIFANAITFAFTFTILMFKLRYK